MLSSVDFLLILFTAHNVHTVALYYSSIDSSLHMNVQRTWHASPDLLPLMFLTGQKHFLLSVPVWSCGVPERYRRTYTPGREGGCEQCHCLECGRVVTAFDDCLLSLSVAPTERQRTWMQCGLPPVASVKWSLSTSTESILEMRHIILRRKNRTTHACTPNPTSATPSTCSLPAVLRVLCHLQVEGSPCSKRYRVSHICSFTLSTLPPSSASSLPSREALLEPPPDAFLLRLASRRPVLSTAEPLGSSREDLDMSCSLNHPGTCPSAASLTSRDRTSCRD